MWNVQHVFFFWPEVKFEMCKNDEVDVSSQRKGPRGSCGAALVETTHASEVPKSDGTNVADVAECCGGVRSRSS